MLKLVKIYSNNEPVFPKIDFHYGINVVYATSTKKERDKKTSHSLGKSKLAEIIDYMLMKQDSNIFLKKNDVFSDFVFYLEVKISKNLYFTIQRPVHGRISIYSSNAAVNILTGKAYTLVDSNLGVRSAKKIFNESVQLSVVRN